MVLYAFFLTPPRFLLLWNQENVFRLQIPPCFLVVAPAGAPARRHLVSSVFFRCVFWGPRDICQSLDTGKTLWTDMYIDVSRVCVCVG